MKEVAVERNGITRVLVDEDRGVGICDLEERFKKGQELLTRFGEKMDLTGKIIPFQIAGVYKVEGCLVDLLFHQGLNPFQAFLTVGEQANVARVQGLLDVHLPIYLSLSSLPADLKHKGTINRKNLYSVYDDFDFAEFSTATDAYKAAREASLTQWVLKA